MTTLKLNKPPATRTSRKPVRAGTASPRPSRAVQAAEETAADSNADVDKTSLPVASRPVRIKRADPARPSSDSQASRRPATGPSDARSNNKSRGEVSTRAARTDRRDAPKASSNQTSSNQVSDSRRDFQKNAADTSRRDRKQGSSSARMSFPDRQAAPRPRPVASQPELPRLSKRMSELGLCSRREAEEWIVNGWVKVDGQVIDTLGTRVEPDARIEVSEKARQHQAEIVTILLHKPVGYVSGQAEDGYQPAIVLVHPDNHWPEDPVDKEFKRGFLRGLAPAGRLDIDSTGLLVLTQDGRIARQLIGEDSGVEKEYLVRVEGELSEEGLRKLNHGLTLDGVKLKPAKVSWQNEDQLRFVLREGRKRQIRRMCELVGLNVVGLKRVRIGSISLGKLPPGQWRYLKAGEKF